MRIGEKKIEGPMVETVVIPRSNEDLVFKCQAVLDYDIFDKLVPEAAAPLKTVRGQKPIPDLSDPDYQKQNQERSYKRFQFMVIQSLKATAGLEWDTVVPENPETWGLLEKELKESGLSPAEVGLIFQGVATANGMNEDRLKEARARFFDTANLTDKRQ